MPKCIPLWKALNYIGSTYMWSSLPDKWERGKQWSHHLQTRHTADIHLASPTQGNQRGILSSYTTHLSSFPPLICPAPQSQVHCLLEWGHPARSYACKLELKLIHIVGKANQAIQPSCLSQEGLGQAWTFIASHTQGLFCLLSPKAFPNYTLENGSQR